MKPKYVKIVVVKHPHCGIHYPFSVPENIDLQVGCLVLCKTRVSDSEVATCITPSFVVGEWQLEEFYGVKLKNLKPVVGILKPEMFPVEKAEEEENT